MPAPWSNGQRVTIHGRIHGQDTVNVLHFASNVAWNVDTIHQNLQNLAQAVIDCVVTTLLPAVTSDWTLVKVQARGIYPTLTDEAIAVPQAAAVGQLGPASHSFSASLANLGTNGGGRRGRGRIFLPPPGEAQVANSVIDGPTVLLIAAFLACLQQKFTEPGRTEDYTLGVFSRAANGGILGNFDNAFRPVTALIANPTCAVMRSRRIGHGN